MIIQQPTIQSAELSQWLDVFLGASRQRIQDVADQRDALDTRGKIFTDLRTKLLALKRLASDMTATGSLSPFGAKTAATSRAGVFTATADASAATHSHSIHVQQLAQPHSVLSNQYTAAGTELAAAFAGTKSFTIHIGDTDHVVSVTIAAGTSNKDVLTAVAAAIGTAAGTTVRAGAITDTDSTARLSLASAEVGTAHQMSFVDSDGLLAALGVTSGTAATGTAGGWLHADLGSHELDAKLTVDGIAIVRSTNSITDVVPGVTLTLQAAQADTDPDVSLSIGVDTKAIHDKMDSFLKAYNDAYSYLNTKVAVDRNTFARGALAGEYSYTNLWQRMRVAVAGPVNSTESASTFALAQIGVTASSTGEFSISDATKFDAALSGDLATVEKLFNSADGVAKRLDSILEGYTKADGVIKASSDSLVSQRKLLNGRIGRMEAVQEMQKSRLIEQYGALQEATKMQQSMLTMLGNLSASLGF